MKSYCKIAGLGVLLISGAAMLLMAVGSPAVSTVLEKNLIFVLGDKEELNDENIADIIAFLHSLTDDY